MDVTGLLHKLGELIENSARIPLTGKVLVDEEDIFEILDEIEASLPEELKQAKLIARERERILDEARQEGEKLLAEAREQVGRLVEESVITQQAKARAEEIVEKAQNISREIRLGALEFADEVLAKTEEQLASLLHTVREARSQLAREKGAEARPA